MALDRFLIWCYNGLLFKNAIFKAAIEHKRANVQTLKLIVDSSNLFHTRKGQRRLKREKGSVAHGRSLGRKAKKSDGQIPSTNHQSS